MCAFLFRRSSTILPPLSNRSHTERLCLRNRFLAPLPAHSRLHLRFAASVQQTRPPRHSAIGSWTVAVACVVTIGSAVLLEELSRPSSPIYISPRKHQPPIEEPTDTPKAAMADSIPLGRPGNLTAEQEEKLKELWKITLKVFGVQKPHDLDEPPPNGTINGETEQASEPTSTAPSQTTTTEALATPEKKKKSRFGFLHRGKGESPSPASPTSPAYLDGVADSLDGANDKYDQNKQFREAVASQSPETIRNTFWTMAKHDHPDGLLLRFLRARKWNVNAALVMAVSTMHWRDQEYHVDDDIILRGEEGCLLDSQGKAEGANNSSKERDGKDFLAQYRMGKSFLHGQDKEGRPMCVVRVRLHHGGDQTVSSLERYTVHTIETARLLLRGNVDTATIVFDMTDFSLANMVRCIRSSLPPSNLISAQGLHSCQIHDQVLRGQLPRIAWSRPRSQSSLGLPGYMEDHSRLARSSRGGQSAFHQQPYRAKRLRRQLQDNEGTGRRGELGI